jgi:hypothetical protein
VDAKTKKKRFMRGVLAATCLTAAGAGAAHAGTVTELNDNFSHSLASPFVLSTGTTQVIGTVSDGAVTLQTDYFAFQDIFSNFDLKFTATSCCDLSAEIFNSSDSPLAGPTTFSTVGGAIHLTGTAPGDHVLIVKLANGTEGAAYQVDLVAGGATAAPEPGAVGLTGLAMGAGLLGLRRRKQAK